MALIAYRAKRDFTKTAEPRGKRRGSGRELAYVIQKHAATRLHYDLRLEWKGVLLSWAVPKGPSLDPKARVLAVQVEDHPVEYGSFEGAIPKGQYGGGSVLLWDRGTWAPRGEDFDASLKKGRIEIDLHGEKLRGAWRLVRMHGAENGRVNWLLMKMDDKFAREGKGASITQARPESVASGRGIEEIGDGERVWQSGRATRPSRQTAKQATAKRASRAARAAAAARLEPSSLEGAKRAKQPAFVSPQLCTLVETAPAGDDWIHEIKLDGYRLVAARTPAGVRLLTRQGKDWTHRFPKIAAAVAALPVKQAVFDGEIVALDARGVSHYQSLQNVLNSGGVGSLAYFVFDLPHCQGYDLTGCPLLERKSLLESLVQGAPTSSPVRYSGHVRGGGPEVFKAAAAKGLEGIICKRSHARYESRRSRSWLKVKRQQGQEFVIGGFTDPKGGRKGFGALLLGRYDKGKELVYAGRVGTGFDHRLLRDIRKQLDCIETRRPAFENPPVGAEARGVHWVSPKLVAQITYHNETSDGLLRHPSFEGLRADKNPKEVVREKAKEAPRATQAENAVAVSKPGAPRKKASRSAAPVHVVAGVALTSADRITIPPDVTKADIAAYYETVAEMMLPHVARRPLMIVRVPSGVGRDGKGERFYQKHITGGMPPSLRGVRIREKHETDTYFYLEDLAGLVALVQISAVEIHAWGSRASDVERPDQLIFDLDPGPGVEWPAIVEAALRVRTGLKALGLESFAKTSGSKGVHVVVPLRPKAGWDEAKGFAHQVVRSIAAAAPERFVTSMRKDLRGGKIFLDYLRNGRGSTCVVPFSTRNRPGAPVSLPVTWRELRAARGSDAFTIETPIARLRRAANAWAGFFDMNQTLPITGSRGASPTRNRRPGGRRSGHASRRPR